MSERVGPEDSGAGRRFPVKRADELMDEEFTAKWRDRQAIDPLARALLGVVLDRIVQAGEPVSVDAVVAQLAPSDPAEIRGALTTLDDKDLVVTHGGRIVLAYPFSAAPTAFAVELPGGRTRYAVCAIDALGVAPMLGEAVTIRSRCHHCGEPLALPVQPEGPVGADGVMVWVGDRGELRQKAFSSL